MKCFLLSTAFAAVCSPGATAIDGDPDLHRVFDAGQQPNDARLQAPKDLNGYFPFDVPATKAEWNKRREELRRRVLVANNLWPMPKKTPLSPVIHGLVERPGFTVEKVYFESLPGYSTSQTAVEARTGKETVSYEAVSGHFVSGLLFRPSGDSPGANADTRPGVLCPHGHGGRTQDYGEANIAQLIESGAEVHSKSGRFPKIARCAQLARMGCTVFLFDMLGYVDSNQISYELAHRYADRRPEFESPDSWGFYSTQAESRLQSIMGLQTWNAIRALDFLESLPDVDASRLAVTGGSGGGTQTILLGAIDSRPIAAFPQGMVSTAMQGGCTCENCSLLRVNAGNVELAALFAPRPQAMTAANDWTKDMMTKGYPQLKQLYAMLGHPENVECTEQLHFPHNYNHATRQLMYRWMNKHLNLGLSEDAFAEIEYEPLTKEEYSVWNQDHPAPEGGDVYERRLIDFITAISDEQIDALTPTDSASLNDYRRIVGGAVETIVGRSSVPSDDIQRTKVWKQPRSGYIEFGDFIRRPSRDEELPVISLYPTAVPWNKQVVLWIDGDGKGGMFTADGLRSDVRRLVDSGFSVVGVDLFQQGDFLTSGTAADVQNRTVANPRQFAGYTYTYNHTLFARRVHDILTTLSWVRGDEHMVDKVHLLGVNGGGVLAAAARAVNPAAADSAAFDTRGFRFSSLTDWKDGRFLPGIVKYGDVPALIALSAGRPTWIGGEAETPGVVEAAFAAAGDASQLASAGDRQDTTSLAVTWLLGQK